MTAQPVCVEPTATFQEFARVFDQNDVSEAPVVDQQGRIVGIVSKTDLIRRCAQGVDDMAPDYLFEILAEQDRVESASEVPPEADIRVEEFMTEDPLTVTPSPSALAVARLMFDRRVHRVVRQLRSRHFGDLSRTLHARIDAIVKRWRTESLLAVPELERLTITEFEDSMALILRAVAAAMETDDPDRLRSVIEHAALHGDERFLQGFTLEMLLAAEATLRGAIIVELREKTGRPLDEGEASALHELIDLMLDHSILAFARKRGERVQQQSAGVQRLADLGTLVAGVAHDAANLLLPLRISLERLKRRDLPADARSHIEVIEQVFQHHQSAILNLRCLSMDASHQPSDMHLDLHGFGSELHSFRRIMLPCAVELEIDIPEGLPRVRISQAALSQILFNLVTNAQQAILSARKRGRIAITARAGPDDTVQLSVEDDGPGMTSAVRERCTEAYFTTKGDGGTGLGLAIVQSLMARAGGTVEIHSPPSGKLAGAGGTVFVLSLKRAAERDRTDVEDSVRGSVQTIRSNCQRAGAGRRAGPPAAPRRAGDPGRSSSGVRAGPERRQPPPGYVAPTVESRPARAKAPSESKHAAPKRGNGCACTAQFTASPPPGRASTGEH